MKKNNLKKIILLPAIASVIVIGCKKDKTTEAPSPSSKIAASESLAIPAEIELPSNLPAGNARVATYYAEGVQKYRAQLKSGGGPIAYEWVFVAPKAIMYDAANKKTGTHGAGPFWEISAGDSLFAQAFSPAKTASVDANSIPWLQLMPKAGKTPTGIFANVSYVQRIATTGGKAPVNPPLSSTDTVDVHYTAVYRFVKKN